MSSSKKKKSDPSRMLKKELVSEVKDLQAKLERRQRKVKKLNNQLKALSEELRQALLTIGKRPQAPSDDTVTPLLAALPSPLTPPSRREIEHAAYHVYLNRLRHHLPGSADTDWLRAESLLWKNLAHQIHDDALRRARESAQPAPTDPSEDLSAAAR